MNFKKTWVLTKDGSSTLKIENLKETYHSLHGAITETEFVYLEKGLRFWQNANPIIFLFLFNFKVEFIFLNEFLLKIISSSNNIKYLFDLFILFIPIFLCIEEDGLLLKTFNENSFDIFFIFS